MSKVSVRSEGASASPKATSWVESLPLLLRPYAYLMRVHMPIGSILIFYPYGWSVAMAAYAVNAPPATVLFHTALLGVSALIWRGAGSTINDIWDRNLDKAVERTRNRPLARGDVSVGQALAFLAAEVAVGITVFAQLNSYACTDMWRQILPAMSSLPLVVIYPLMKRVMDLPQVVLGLTVNLSVLVGWSAVAGPVNWNVCLPLYLGGVCWTVVYDTVYAHQDIADDKRAGIRSTALLFGRHARAVLLGLSFSALACTLLAIRANSSAHAAAWVGAALGGAHLVRVVYSTRFDEPKSCGNGFVECGWFGFWLWMGLVVDYTLLKML